MGYLDTFLRTMERFIVIILKSSPVLTSSIKNENLIIQVDGGINAQTGKICKDFGANSLVAGSYVYGAEDIAQAINSLK